jgi:hypothetical protein
MNESIEKIRSFLSEREANQISLCNLFLNDKIPIVSDTNISNNIHNIHSNNNNNNNSNMNVNTNNN